MPKNFKIIVITSEKEGGGEISSINGLLEAGLELLHLRKPAYGLEEAEKLLKAIPSDFHPRIVIHNHYELLNKYKLKGAHLPEKTRNENNLAKIKNITSTSFHILEDVIAEKNSFEYAFFSPVFQSISKQGYAPSVDIKAVSDFFKHNENELKFTIIALGGITDKNILQVRDMGFAGAACLGYIWEATDPVERFITLRKILQD